MGSAAAAPKNGPVEPVPAAAEVDGYADRWAVVPKTGAAPVLDGELEEAWASGFHASGFVTMYDKQAAGSDTDMYWMYTDDSLYLALEGHKEQPERQPETEIVEVLLSPGGAGGSHYRLRVPISEGGREIAVDWGEKSDILKGAQVQIARHDDAWTLEAQIPFRSLGLSGVAEGDAWRFNVVRYYGINSDPFSSWVPVRQSYLVDQGTERISMVAHLLNQQRTAPLFFSKPSLPELPAGGKAEPWQPEKWRLEYTSYESKTLVLSSNAIHADTKDLQLVWESPDGQSTLLDAPAIVRQQNETRLSFRHPRPLANGQYRLKAAFRQGQGAYRYFELSFDRQDLIKAGDEGVRLPQDNGPKRQLAYAEASPQVQSLLQLVPDTAGFIFTGLPENPDLRPYQLYNWSPDNPQQIVAKSTGTAYPNPAYPENHKLTAVNRQGETVEYPYYEDDQGRRYFFSAHLWYFQKDYVLRETAKLADTDPLGAARLLNRWLEAYKGYLPTNDYYWTNYPVVSGPPYHYWGGVWYRWYTGEMTNMSYLITAYEKVKQTNAFDLLKEELGVDLGQKLVEDMFVPSFEFVRSFPILNHNMEYTTWLGLVRMAKATGDPSYMHEVVELMQDFARNYFLSDGFWKEVTISYHNQSVGGLLQGMDLSKGWSDPAGYTSPRTGQRIDNLDMAKSFPALSKAKTMGDIVSYPNGSYVPVMDTWANEKSKAPQTSLGSYLLASSGISRLTLGSGASQQQMYLNFVPKYGHNHLDPLNLTLFAKGQELLPDIGYTHTFFRKWTTSTLAHNTVVVNGSDMSLANGGEHGGQIQTFAASDDTVKIEKASQGSAYPVTDQYEREPWMIRFDGGAPEDGYVVDLFRVSGGDRHEYTLGGDANRDATFTANMELQPYNDYLLPPGTKVRMPESENDNGDAQGNYYGYLYVQDVKRAEVPDGRYELTLNTSQNGTEQAKLKVTGIVDPGANELFLGKAPSLQATRLNGTTKDLNTEAVKYWMPKMVLRRTGTDLTSTFVNVMEAYKGEQGPKIEQVEKLTPSEGAPGSVALKLTYGATTDYVLSAAGGSTPLKVDDIELQGGYGFIRTVDGEITKMVLIDGTKLQKGAKTVTGAGPVTGTVKQVLRQAEGAPYDALLVDAEVAADAAGKTVIVTHSEGKTHGYPIQEVRNTPEGTLLLLKETDAGWQYLPDGTSQMAFFPFHTWKGMATFRISNIAAQP